MNSSKDKLTVSEIRQEVERRGIRGLCHFTPVESLSGIIQDQRVWSRSELLRRRPNALVNDQSRVDGHTEYVCCSVQYPNLYLLDRFRYRGHINSNSAWAVLIFKRDLLAHPRTRFCPLNAAKDYGAHIGDGLEGLLSMFAYSPPPSDQYRRITHLETCPTDRQAEVLVHHSVPIEAIVGVVLESNESRRAVQREVKKLPRRTRPAIMVVPEFFNKYQLTGRVWRGEETPLPTD
jgi:hypothetical protein